MAGQENHQQSRRESIAILDSQLLIYFGFTGWNLSVLEALSNGAELERRIIALAGDGVDDEQIAQQLTAEGFR